MGFFQNADVPVLVSFAIYLLIMIGIGFYFSNKSKKMSDYFLAGRGLNSWVTAMSAQASDMSGWLLMGLPGAAYAAGMGNYWIAIGLAIGTILNWAFVAKPLRRFSISGSPKRKVSITKSGKTELRLVRRTPQE